MTNYGTKEIYKLYVKGGGKLAYLPFKQIMDSFHKKITDECIKGYSWRMPYNLGTVRIVIRNRKFRVMDNGIIKGAVDWGESNKLKAKIIAEGGTPLEMYKDEQGNIIGDNGGRAWLCYFTTSSYYAWTYLTNIYLKNAFKYAFKISWSNSKKLSASITEDSILLYEKVTT